MTLDWLTYFPSPARGVWHLGPIPIRAYALCIIVGIIAALLIGDRRWQARGGEPGVIYDIALWVVPFGLIGGRLYHLATDWRTYFGDAGVGWQATPRIWDGGLGIWGAVALGGVGAWIGCRRRGIPLPAFADAVAPGVILAQAIGRIGNYFNQELYGRETALPWGMKIFWREDASGMRDPHLLDGVSTGEIYKIVQPTFLYELLWNLLVFGLLLYADRRFRMGHGRLFALYVAGYCLGRFGVELLRDDTATHIAGIRINSFTATFVFIGAVVYILLATKGREDPADLRRGWHTDEPADEVDRDTVGGEPDGTAAVPAEESSGDSADAASKPEGAQSPEPVRVALGATMGAGGLAVTENGEAADDEADDAEAADTEADDTEVADIEADDAEAADTEADSTEVDDTEADDAESDTPVAGESDTAALDDEPEPAAADDTEAATPAADTEDAEAEAEPDTPPAESADAADDDADAEGDIDAAPEDDRDLASS